MGAFDRKPASVNHRCRRAPLDSRPARAAWSSTPASRESEAIVMSREPPLHLGVQAAAGVYGWWATPEAVSFLKPLQPRAFAALPVSRRPLEEMQKRSR